MLSLDSMRSTQLEPSPAATDDACPSVPLSRTSAPGQLQLKKAE